VRDEVAGQVAQQVVGARSGRGWAGHGKGVNDLGRAGGIFGVDAVKKGEDIHKQRGRLMVGQEGVEASERAVVGGGAEQR
jgi:hypothetical protein